MGAGQSNVRGQAAKDPDAARRKRQYSSLRESRLKYISELLESSEPSRALHEANCGHGTEFGDSATTAERDLLLKASEGGTGVENGNSSFQRKGRYDRSPDSYDEVDHKAIEIRPEDYDFRFENLVFEGGGMKGLAYCGAIRYLEDLGLMEKKAIRTTGANGKDVKRMEVNQVRRFAGASAGSMVAALLAVGYDSHQIQHFLSDRVDKVFLDASCGYCSFLPNLLRTFGWNPGQRIYDWFGEKLEEKTEDADITFHQVYQKYGNTLCIVVTNLSQMTTEYCHPKTTPDMPIRVAIRMSMAIPGLFSAVKYEHFGNVDVYVDGGVLCNYPIHCFDGSYLSMDAKEPSVLRHQPRRDATFCKERDKYFESYNDNTLGMLLYSDSEEDILRCRLESRVGCLDPAKPKKETALFKEREKEAVVKMRAVSGFDNVVQAIHSFMKVLQDHNLDRNDVIDRQELEAAFKDEEFPRHQAEVLFGKDFTVNEAFNLLDYDNDGQIRYEELVRFIEENGVCLQSRFLGYQRKDIKNIATFLDSLQSCLVFNVKKLLIEERDLERTVGINTGHIQTTDFVLEEPDIEFVVERGRNSMRAFLQYYVVQHPDKVQRRAVSGKKTPGHSPEAAMVPDFTEDAKIPDTSVASGKIPEIPEDSNIPDNPQA